MTKKLIGNIIMETDAVLDDRAVSDWYPTQRDLVKAVVNLIVLPTDVKTPMILDPGSGTGVWGEELRKRFPDAFITGIESDPSFDPNPSYDRWVVADYLSGWCDFDTKFRGFDVVAGNPPYGQTDGVKDRRLAEKFVRRTFQLIKHTYFSQIHFLLLLNFLGSSVRWIGDGKEKSLFQQYPIDTITIIPQRPSFKKHGRSDAREYMIATWYYDQVNFLKNKQFEVIPLQALFWKEAQFIIRMDGKYGKNTG